MSRLRGLRLYTPSFTVPHKKKSSGVSTLSRPYTTGFLLVRHSKRWVHKRNLDILWNEIQAVCREISLDVLIRCTESVVTRTQNCIDAAGHQFEQY
ncbi:hypothetical protein LAZ67_11000644 [Cordylochernes scorpioides]|uniref:Uncharacterized protein n=1 Tax=Cordylochernes scorpioides TaxID=51811 RepID=A0ABY6KXU7_9ARAC|nr:hypothetical protein LAZ67_11000644 [Cordylochernes scorpioides]